MKNWFVSLTVALTLCGCREKIPTPAYRVAYASVPVSIDARWDKHAWRIVDSIAIACVMGDPPSEKPSAWVKVCYDSANVYVIFKVLDPYVHSATTEINGPVWDDACVEFFFAPDGAHPEWYFNLEVNAGGVPLMRYNTVPRKAFVKLPPEEIAAVEIAHTLPQVVEPEIHGPIEWIVEYRIPLWLLQKHAPVTSPAKSVQWMANFYKTTAQGSNPHYLTWSPIASESLDFHRPEFFGTLAFE